MKNINENTFPGFDNSYELTCNIQEDLEDSIDDIFYKYQTIMKIETGDVMPDLYLDLSDLTEKLSECIAQALETQKNGI